MPFPDLEYFEPKKANADGSDADDGAGEKVEDYEEENDIVDWEDFGRFDEDPVHGIENVDMAQDVSAMTLADRILRLVDKGQKHGHPDEYCHNHQ